MDVARKITQRGRNMSPKAPSTTLCHIVEDTAARALALTRHKVDSILACLTQHWTSEKRGAAAKNRRPSLHSARLPGQRKHCCGRRRPLLGRRHCLALNAGLVVVQASRQARRESRGRRQWPVSQQLSGQPTKPRRKSRLSAHHDGGFPKHSQNPRRPRLGQESGGRLLEEPPKASTCRKTRLRRRNFRLRNPSLNRTEPV